MLRPPYLKSGDVIGIVAPASYVTEEDVLPSLEMIHSWGLRARLGRHLFGCRNSFSGTDAQRSSDFQEMIDNEEVRAIWCARGGYGCLRIIGRLNLQPLIDKPKWIIGYSDVTVIHAALQQMGIESLHAVMPRCMNSAKPDIHSFDTLKEALFGNLTRYDFDSHPKNRCGTSKGILAGGNLSVLFSLKGTPWDLSTERKILMVEDTGEYLYHIDRMMVNLRLSGKLEQLNGMVIGGMSDMKVSASGFRKSYADIIREAVRDYTFPVIYGFAAGHVSPNKALIFGRTVTMHVSKAESSLIF